MKKIWPLFVIVIANTFYNICTKEVTSNINSFLALFVTYLVAFFLCIIMFFITSKDKNIMNEMKKVNKSSIILVLGVTGLEIGYVFVYRVGWAISIAALIANLGISIALLFIGVFLYKEMLNKTQLFGILLCILGLVIINL